MPTVTPILFENKITKERYTCDNIKLVRWFNGEAFLSVRREGETRKVLVKRDALQEITTK